MHAIPPPTPDPIPDPLTAGDDAPGAAASGRESDVLKRRDGFSWKALGGDGFLVSLALHVVLGVCALLWAIDRALPVAGPGVDKSVFETCPKRGVAGPQTSSTKRMTNALTRPATLPSRVVVSGGRSTVALPATPEAPAPGFAPALAGGELAGGFGGLGDRGTGGGAGPGNDSGRMHVGDFWRSAGGDGLPGVFYDCKQTPAGAPTAYAPDTASAAFADEVLRPFIRKFDRTRLDTKYFRAPEGLTAAQFLIPHTGADAAPRAYGVAGKCRGSRWIAVYGGRITAPKSGKFRFWGLGDDALVVRIDGKLVLDAGWTLLTESGGHANHASAGKVLGVTETRRGAPGAAFRAGPWISFTKGRESAMDLMISEIPGGLFGAWLFMEEAGPDGKGDGKLFLFRLTADELPEGLRDNSGLNADLTGKGLVWNGRDAGRTGVRR